MFGTSVWKLHFRWKAHSLFVSRLHAAAISSIVIPVFKPDQRWNILLETGGKFFIANLTTKLSGSAFKVINLTSFLSGKMLPRQAFASMEGRTVFPSSWFLQHKSCHSDSNTRNKSAALRVTASITEKNSSAVWFQMACVRKQMFCWTDLTHLWTERPEAWTMPRRKDCRSHGDRRKCHVPGYQAAWRLKSVWTDCRSHFQDTAFVNGLLLKINGNLVFSHDVSWPKRKSKAAQNPTKPGSSLPSVSSDQGLIDMSLFQPCASRLTLGVWVPFIVTRGIFASTNCLWDSRHKRACLSKKTGVNQTSFSVTWRSGPADGTFPNPTCGKKTKRKTRLPWRRRARGTVSAPPRSAGWHHAAGPTCCNTPRTPPCSDWNDKERLMLAFEAQYQGSEYISTVERTATSKITAFQDTTRFVAKSLKLKFTNNTKPNFDKCQKQWQIWTDDSRNFVLVQFACTDTEPQNSRESNGPSCGADPAFRHHVKVIDWSQIESDLLGQRDPLNIKHCLKSLQLWLKKESDSEKSFTGQLCDSSKGPKSLSYSKLALNTPESSLWTISGQRKSEKVSNVRTSVYFVQTTIPLWALGLSSHCCRETVAGSAKVFTRSWISRSENNLANIDKQTFQKFSLKSFVFIKNKELLSHANFSPS